MFTRHLVVNTLKTQLRMEVNNLIPYFLMTSAVLSFVGHTFDCVCAYLFDAMLFFICNEADGYGKETKSEMISCTWRRAESR